MTHVPILQIKAHRKEVFDDISSEAKYFQSRLLCLGILVPRHGVLGYSALEYCSLIATVPAALHIKVQRRSSAMAENGTGFRNRYRARAPGAD